MQLATKACAKNYRKIEPLSVIQLTALDWILGFGFPSLDKNFIVAGFFFELEIVFGQEFDRLVPASVENFSGVNNLDPDRLEAHPKRGQRQLRLGC